MDSERLEGAARDSIREGMRGRQTIGSLSSSQSFDTTFAQLFSFISLSPTLHTHLLILSLLLSYLSHVTLSYLTHHFTFITSHSLSFFQTCWFIPMTHMTRAQLSTHTREDDPHRPT